MAENKTPTWSDTHPLCGLYACNVVISEYNENGKCRCLKCPGCGCQYCDQYKKLLEESFYSENLVAMQRCLNCQKQQEKQK